MRRYIQGVDYSAFMNHISVTHTHYFATTTCQTGPASEDHIWQMLVEGTASYSSSPWHKITGALQGAFAEECGAFWILWDLLVCQDLGEGEQQEGEDYI